MRALLIPSGGFDKTGKAYEWTKRRLDRAIEIQRKSDIFITLSRGTTHKPPRQNEKGFPIDESMAAAEYLARHGVNPQHIRTERVSFDTIGNIYFAKLLFIDPQDINEIVIIQSAFVMEKTKAIVDWVFHLTPEKTSYHISYIEVSDEGIDQDIIQARREKDKIDIKAIKQNTMKLTDRKSFHAWLFSEHKAYAYGLDAASTIDAQTLKSY